MSDILFLGFGPIASSVVEALKQESVKRIQAISKFGQINRSEKNVDFLNIDNREHSLFLETEIVVVSWRELTEEREFFLSFLTEALPPQALIINLSSGSVYGSGIMMNEEQSIPKPMNEYGRQKLLIENTLNLVMKQRVINFRISNLYGSALPQSLPIQLITAISTKNRLQIFDLTSIRRDYVYLEDFLLFLSSCLENTNWKSTCPERLLINFSSGIGTTTDDLIRLLEGYTHQEITMLDLIETPLGTIVENTLDPSILETVFDFKPRLLEVGLRELLDNLGISPLSSL